MGLPACASAEGAGLRSFQHKRVRNHIPARDAADDSVQSHSCTFRSRRYDACTAPSISTAEDRRRLRRPAASPTRNSASAASALRPACSRRASPGDRVAYLSFNTHQLLEGYFGVLLAGAIVMPLNVRLTPVELDRHSQPRRAAHPDLRAGFRAARRASAPGLPGGSSLHRNRSRPTKTAVARPHRAARYHGLSTKTPSPSCSTPAAAPARRRASCCRTARSTCTRFSVAATFGQGRRQRGAAHHPAVPRQWLGPRALLHHVRRQAGDGAALRSRARARA